MSLSRVQTLRLAAVLEDCRDQLDILGLTLALRAQRDRGPGPRPRPGWGPQETSGPTQQDLRRPRSLCCRDVSQQVSRLLEDTMRSFTDSDGVCPPSETVTELEEGKESWRRRAEELQQKREKLQDLERLVSELKLQLSRQSAEIRSMRNMLELTQKERSQAEELLRGQLELLHKQLKEEAKVHLQAKAFLQHRHQELLRLQQSQTCMSPLQQKEQQLNRVSCRRTLTADRLADTRRKLREMQQLLTEDREEREKLRHLQEEARAATKLQAWWRSCRVRRGLGTFKRTQEAEKGKKKKEGKKKQKKKKKK